MLTTKLHVPRPRAGAVPRRRLLDQLRRGAGSKLTLVSAPAGFAKTTLLAQWLALDGARAAEGGRAFEDGRAFGGDRASEGLGQAPDGAVAWLSLDSTDNDPAQFWISVLTALGSAVPGLGSAAVELLRSAQMPTVPLRTVLTAVLNDLAAAPAGTCLVLDDYHVIEDREGDLRLAHRADGSTSLRGAVSDQAELYAVLRKVRDLGVPLISLRTLGARSGRSC